MEYYKLNKESKNEIKNIYKDVYTLANELGQECFFNALENGEVYNYEDEDIFQYFIISDYLFERMKDSNQYVLMQAKGLNFWCRLGFQYDLKCDLVNVWKHINK
tara:strand:- start:192 stop:503 length:312 start_codon:yes stop_codon:yes gene_type:complete